jgi:hypothetical protein
MRIKLNHRHRNSIFNYSQRIMFFLSYSSSSPYKFIDLDFCFVLVLGLVLEREGDLKVLDSGFDSARI